MEFNFFFFKLENFAFLMYKLTILIVAFRWQKSKKYCSKEEKKQFEEVSMCTKQ